MAMHSGTLSVLLEESCFLEDSVGGYRGPGADVPRKYIRGDLSNAYAMDDDDDPVGLPLNVYYRACKALGAKPNSWIEASICYSGAGILNSEMISLSNTYLGEKGFLAALPIIHRNLNWKMLDVSGNGLRNEAVLCLVDMLLGYPYTGRSFHLDLSRNPISETGARALLELAKAERIESLYLRSTKVPRELLVRLEQAIAEAKVRKRRRPRQETLWSLPLSPASISPPQSPRSNANNSMSTTASSVR